VSDQYIYSEDGINFVITENPESAPEGATPAPISGEGLDAFVQIVESFGGTVSADESYFVSLEAG